MILPVRILSILTALLLAFGILTQATAAGPDSPVSLPTPTPTAEPSTNAPGPGLANPTWPYGYLPIDLAAVVLPETALPNVFYQSGELYLDADRVSNYNYGIPSAEEVAAVGFVQGYTVFFNSNAQSTIRITVLLFRDARYMQAAFDLLQDDDRINPNGLMTDGPAVKGAGDAPAETTSGYRENGDGTTTQIYSATFTIDRMQITVEMTSDGADEPDTELVDQLAVAQAERATAILAGDLPEDIDPDLPGLMVWPNTDTFTLVGYADTTEDYLLATMDTVPDGFRSAFAWTVSLEARADTYYPVLSVTLASFDSKRDLRTAFADPGTLMGSFPGQKQIDDPDLDGADATAAFTYQLADIGPGIRIFAQVGSYLVIVDVQGSDDVEGAAEIANAFANATISCAAGDGCALPTDLPTGTVFDPTPVPDGD